MRLPSFKRIFKQDFPEETYSWVDKMAFIVNNSFDVLYDLANHKISLEHNTLSVRKDIVLIVDNNGIPQGLNSVSLDNVVKTVRGTEIQLAENQTNSAIYPTSGPFVTGSQSGNTYVIKHITGLTPGDQWLVRIVVWG